MRNCPYSQHRFVLGEIVCFLCFLGLLPFQEPKLRGVNPRIYGNFHAFYVLKGRKTPAHFPNPDTLIPNIQPPPRLVFCPPCLAQERRLDIHPVGRRPTTCVCRMPVCQTHPVLKASQTQSPSSPPHPKQILQADPKKQEKKNLDNTRVHPHTHAHARNLPTTSRHPLPIRPAPIVLGRPTFAKRPAPRTVRHRDGDAADAGGR